MINKENLMSNSVTSDGIEELIPPRKSTENSNNHEGGEWNISQQIYHFSVSDLEFFNASSFKTISCRSLDIEPEPCLLNSFRSNIDQEEIMPKQSSSNSIEEERNQELLENQRKLVLETRQLIISDSDEDSQSQMSTSKYPRFHRNHSKRSSSEHCHSRKIVKVKHLRMRTKKLLSKGIEEVNGNFLLRGDNSEVIVKNGLIRFLTSEKGQIGSLLIRKGEQQYFLKLKNLQQKKQEIRVQRWNKVEERWNQFILSLELHVQ